MTNTQKCKRGCRWPTYTKKDRYGDEETYCMGCDKPVDKCDCRREREKARQEAAGKQPAAIA